MIRWRVARNSLAGIRALSWFRRKSHAYEVYPGFIDGDFLGRNCFNGAGATTAREYRTGDCRFARWGTRRSGRD